MSNRSAATLSTSGRPRLRAWPVGAWRWLLLAPLLLLTLMPVLTLALSWGQIEALIWAHLAEHLLPRLVTHSLMLMLGVGFGVLTLGVPLAWLSACCEYPGRRWLEPLLIVPLAFPAYVLAFVYLGLLDYAGPVQTTLRASLGAVPAPLRMLAAPEGVIVVLTLALFPYVYLLVRASFTAAGLSSFEAGRSLGRGALRVFFTVCVPAARPAIVAGLSLALMEALADFGAVSVFGFDTFTTAVYKTWLGMFNLAAAAQLASLLMLFMLLLIAGERLHRRAVFRTESRLLKPHRIRLTGLHAFAATAFVGLVVTLATVVPLVQLLVWALPRIHELAEPRLLQPLFSSLTLGLSGAVLTVGAGLIMVIASWRAPRRLQMAAELAATGYAIPGTVLAVALLATAATLDRHLGWTLAGSAVLLLMAYLIRFARAAWGPLDAVAARIRPHHVEVARSLGASRLQVLTRVFVPLLRPGLVSAFLLTAVEVIKEMPATLLLRPFGWDTLSVRVYELTAEGQWERAAIPALVLVALGSLPAFVLLGRGALAARGR